MGRTGRPSRGEAVGPVDGEPRSAKAERLAADLAKLATEAGGPAVAPEMARVPVARTEANPIDHQAEAEHRAPEKERRYGIDDLIDRAKAQDPGLVIDATGALDREQALALAAQVKKPEEYEHLQAGLYRRGMFKSETRPDGTNVLVGQDDKERAVLSVLTALESQLEDQHRAAQEVKAAKAVEKSRAVRVAMLENEDTQENPDKSHQIVSYGPQGKQEVLTTLPEESDVLAREQNRMIKPVQKRLSDGELTAELPKMPTEGKGSNQEHFDGGRLNMTAFEAALDRVDKKLTKTGRAETSSAGQGGKESEIDRAYKMTRSLGVVQPPKSDLTPKELHDRIAKASNPIQLSEVFELGVGAGHLDLGGGARTRAAEVPGELSGVELSRELEAKIAALPNSVEKSRLLGRLDAGRDWLKAEQERQGKNPELVKDAREALEAALGEDREAAHQFAVAERFNSMRDAVKGDVMMQRQIDAARDAAMTAEKGRQQRITEEVGELAGETLQRAYKREMGSEVLDAGVEFYEEKAMLMRRTLDLQGKPVFEGRRNGIVESEFQPRNPDFNNILVLERRDERSGRLLSQRVMTLDGPPEFDRRGRVRLAGDLNTEVEGSLYADIHSKRSLGRSTENLRGDLSSVYYGEDYGATKEDVEALRREQATLGGRLARVTREGGRRVLGNARERLKRGLKRVTG